jgi:hypothetical protein
VAVVRRARRVVEASVMATTMIMKMVMIRVRTECGITGGGGGGGVAEDGGTGGEIKGSMAAGEGGERGGGVDGDTAAGTPTETTARKAANRTIRQTIPIHIANQQGRTKEPNRGAGEVRAGEEGRVRRWSGKMWRWVERLQRSLLPLLLARVAVVEVAAAVVVYLASSEN